MVKLSYFVKCLREWYEACDSRGIDHHDRIEKLLAMDELLTRDVDFSSFPPPGVYIKGIPIVTCEGILVNNCHKLSLYQALENGYNYRAFSTLNVENVFGDMTSMEYSGLGCLKSMDIFCLMSHSLQLTCHLLDPTRKFVCEQ